MCNGIGQVLYGAAHIRLVGIDHVIRQKLDEQVRIHNTSRTQG